MNDNYQQELIGILGSKPQYFNSTILTKEYFDKPFDYMFEKMRLSYKKNGTVNYQDILEDNNIADDLFVACISNVIQTHIKYFKSLESMAIEKYKARMIHEYNSMLIRGDIDVNGFTNRVKKLENISSSELKKLTGNTIREYTKKENKSIIFNDFKRFGAVTKIKEHDLVILAGKTGTGKTGLALNLLSDLSKTYPCIYLNIEMSEDSIVQRMIALNKNIMMNSLENCYNIHQSELNRIYEYANELDGNSNIYYDTGSQSINNIKSTISSFDQDSHYIVFIDHIGLIKCYGKGAYEKMTNTVLELRNLSLDYNCTIIGLCQLSRESAKADRPSNNLLRDSGEVEQSARKVIFVWEEKDESYNIYVTKNDSGPRGRMPVTYNKATQKFTEGDKKDVRK